MLKGSCLCGGIRFEIAGTLGGIVQCHCSLCRKSSGTGSIATILVAAEKLSWLSGESLIRTFERPSGYGTAFCSICGSPAPASVARGQRYAVPAGLLEGDPPLRVVEHIFVGSKAQWDVIGDDAPRLDTM
jgi:hypothetical protein